MMLEIFFLLFLVGVLLITYLLYRWYKQDESHTNERDFPDRFYLLEGLEKNLLARRELRFSCVLIELVNLKDYDSKLHKKVMEIFGNQLQELEAINHLSSVKNGTYGFIMEGDASVQAQVVRTIQTQLIKPITIKDKEIKLKIAIGINSFPKENTNAKDMLKKTQIVLKHAKYKSPRILTYTEENHLELNYKEEIYQAFQDAFERGEFHLVYLPEVELTTGKVKSVEALLRWNSPKLGKVSPADFIPIAEELDMIYSVAKWVLNEAMKHAKLWKDRGVTVPVTVNISSKQLENEDFISMIERGLSYYNIDPSSILIEMPEIVLRDRLRLSKKLVELEELGVQLIIDDFGKDFSALGVFQHTSFNGIKIDPSFIESVPEDKAATGILRMILRTAHAIGLEVIAKGIETKNQKAVLIKENCLYGQGYLFSKPLQAEKVPQFVRISTAKMKA